MMNNILNNKMCPCFNYTYCIQFCDHCEVVSAVLIPRNQKLLLVLLLWLKKQIRI